MLILLIVLILLLCLLVPTLVAGHSLAPWLPSHAEDVEAALDLAAAKPGETFYDLGCGEGQALRVAARRGLNAVGIELSPLLFFAAKALSVFTPAAGAGSASVLYGNLFKADISNADIIYVYGMPDALRGPFARKLEREAKPGVRVVSCHFHIRAWKEKAVGRSTRRDTALYLYEVPTANA